MTNDEFLHGLKSRAADSAVRNTITDLEKPVGRRPAPKALRLAKWYSSLDSDSRNALSEAIREAVEHAVFGFLCILDGARVIEESEDKGEFELYYVKGAEKRLLNPLSDPLHEAYRKFMETEGGR